MQTTAGVSLSDSFSLRGKVAQWPPARERGEARLGNSPKASFSIIAASANFPKMHDSWAVSELDQGEPVDYSAFSTARIMMGDLFRPRNPPEDRSRSGDAGPGNVATGK